MKRLLVPLVVLLSACAPAHLRSVGPGGSREMQEFFLGGWDGRRLGVFDDSGVEPGVTTANQLAKSLRHLSGDLYAVVYIESAKLDAVEARKHGLECATAMCLVVFEGKGASELSGWGPAIAIFELKGIGEAPLGPVWLAGRAIRSPGPRRWDLFCRSKTDEPRFVHPDGGALYPARPGPSGDAFALFGPTELPASYRREGFTAPSETLCDEELVRLQAEPAPERPEIKADPTLVGPDAK